MADVRFKISAVSESPTKVKVNARKFTMIIDEPPNLGGTDEGANPLEYVLSALAGCLNVVGHVVAREMRINIRHLSIEVTGTLNPDKCFGKSAQDRAGFKNIDVTIKVDSDADETKLKEWVEKVEDRCPVSDNLQNPTPMNIKVERIRRKQ